MKSMFTRTMSKLKTFLFPMMINFVESIKLLSVDLTFVALNYSN